MTAFRFKAGGAISPRDSSSYVSRKADHDASALLRTMEYLLIIEPRQQGKTSLLGQLSTRLANAERLVAYVDVEDLSYSSEGAWYSGLWRDLGNQLGHVLGDAMKNAPADSQEWRYGLQSIAAYLDDRSTILIVALDEVGSMGKAWWAEAFFVTLRKFYNLRAFSSFYNSITFALSGAFHPRDLIKDDKISPFNVAQRVRLEDFNPAQVQELVSKGYWSFEQIEILAKRIHFWSGGQPYLTQMLCGYLSTDATPADVDLAVERLRLEDGNHLSPILEKLHQDEKLHKYINDVKSGKRFKFLPHEHPRQAQLELLGLLKADEDGYCQIRNRIYELVLHPHDNPISSFLTSVGETNSKANELESDHPSPSSFLLSKQNWITFKLQLARQVGIEFETRAFATSMGEPHATSRLPFPAANVTAVLTVMEHNDFDPADYSSDQTETLQQLGLVRNGRLAHDHLKRIGQGLHEALFSGDVGV